MTIWIGVVHRKRTLLFGVDFGSGRCHVITCFVQTTTAVVTPAIVVMRFSV